VIAAVTAPASRSDFGAVRIACHGLWSGSAARCRPQQSPGHTPFKIFHRHGPVLPAPIPPASPRHL